MNPNRTLAQDIALATIFACIVTFIAVLTPDWLIFMD